MSTNIFVKNVTPLSAWKGFAEFCGRETSSRVWQYNTLCNVTPLHGKHLAMQLFVISLDHTMHIESCKYKMFCIRCAKMQDVELWIILSKKYYINIRPIFKHYTATSILIYVHGYKSGPGSVVGIATAYGLNGRGIESPWGWDFPHLSRPALRPTQPPVKWIPSLSRG
jgi:hypothetical protein